jgi:hypothetical protein
VTRALALLALVGLGACGGPSAPMLATDVPARLPAEYEAALDRWTRGGESYEAFEGRVFVRSTWFSPEFAAAYADRSSERLGLSRAEATGGRAALVKNASEEARFLVVLNTHDPRWSDLGAPGSTLRVALRQGEDEVRPTAVDRVDEERQADLFPFFPYVGPLTTVYWVTFPPVPDPKHVTLRIAGPPAVVDLKWENP